MNGLRASLLRILALTRKELLAVLKDRRARMSLLVPAIVQALVFGYAATYDLNHVPYAVIDQDQSQSSRTLLAGLDGSGLFERVAELHRAADIATWIDARRALLVLQIPSDFERRLQNGSGAVVQVIADGRNSNTPAPRSDTSVVSSISSTANGEARMRFPPRASRWSPAPGTTPISRLAGI
jgi:ABC-2 type transport system permease protein